MKSGRIKFLGLLVLGAVVLFGLSKIRFEVDMLRLLPPNLRQVEGLSYFLKYFARPAELIVTVESADADLAEEASDSLAEMLNSHPDLVRQATNRPPWETQPEEMSGFLAYLFLNAETDRIREAVNRVAPDRAGQTLAESKERIADSGSPMEVLQLTRDPFRFSEALADAGMNPSREAGEFSSPDGTFRVLYVTAARPLKDYRETIAWVEAIRALMADWKGDRDVVVGLTGEPAFVAEISSSMQWEMMSSGVGTLLLVGLIFWAFQRRIRPVIVLMGILVVVYFLTLATAGFVLTELTVIGAGFASIMVGLGVDYGYLLYQDWRDQGGDVGGLRRRQSFAIWSASLTTAAAFFALNFSSLPGLSQLGNLVGIGILIAAVCMQTLYVAFLSRIQPPRSAQPVATRLLVSDSSMKVGRWVVAGLVLFLIAVCVFRGIPPLDISMRAFRSQRGSAHAVLDRLNERLLEGRKLLSLIVVGKDEAEVFTRLNAAEADLAALKQGGGISEYALPLALWPEPDRQRNNLDLLAPLANEKPRLLQTLDEGGFTEDAFSVAEPVLDIWRNWKNQPVPIWPSDRASQWVLRRLAYHEDGFAAAMGIVTPVSGMEEQLAPPLGEGTYLVSWDRLASELKKTVPGEFAWLVGSLILVVLLLLGLIFRKVSDVLLIAATMATVFAALNGAMVLFGIEWNFFNLAAVLLLLGTGVDYSIYMILALRRNPGTIADVQKSMAKVIFLCATSAAAGFGSISWFSNYGLASLGRTCALGLILDALIVVYLLPVCWSAVCNRKQKPNIESIPGAVWKDR